MIKVKWGKSCLVFQNMSYKCTQLYGISLKIRRNLVYDILRIFEFRYDLMIISVFLIGFKKINWISFCIFLFPILSIVGHVILVSSFRRERHHIIR